MSPTEARRQAVITFGGVEGARERCHEGVESNFLATLGVSPVLGRNFTAIDPVVPVDLETLSARVDKLADQPRFETFLVGFFAATGLLLAIIGLYGVISFLVAQRTQEIGVRMALGADRGDILRLVLGASLRLILLGTATGLFAALAASRLLASLLYGIGPHDPAIFAFVTLLLLGVTTLATLVPATSAAKVDPMVALRND